MTVAYTYNALDRERFERILTRAIPDGRKPAGLILVAAGEEQGGAWRVIEVWDSDEERTRWEQGTLLPLLQQAGVDTSSGPPEWDRVEVSHLVER